jgi:hypothetical protein
LHRVRQERLGFFQTLAKQGLLPGHQSILIDDVKPFPQSHFVGYPHEVLLIGVPIQMNPEGFERLIPGPMVQRLGVRQDAVEIEQQRVERQSRMLRAASKECSTWLWAACISL